MTGFDGLDGFVPAHAGQRLAHHFEKFEQHVLRHGSNARDVSSGTGETLGQPRGDWCVQAGANDRNGPRQVLNSYRREIGGDNHGAGMKRQQLGRKRRKPAGVTARPTCLEYKVLPLHQAEFAHAAVKHGHLHLA
jgi:hypothetical protein